jgi:hypothetical protein
MGDVNCDFLKPPPDPRTRKLQFLSSLYQFDLLINEPTRVTGTSATGIDLIFTNRVENILNSGIVHVGISDHSVIFAVRKFRVDKSQKNTRYFRNFKRFSSNDFLTDLSQVQWETVAQYENPNMCWQIWSSLFLQVLDRHASLRCMRVRGNSIPWMSSNIRGLMRLRDLHKGRAVKYNAQNHWIKYKQLRNKVNSEIRKAKTMFSATNLRNVRSLKIQDRVGNLLMIFWVKIGN